MPQRCLVLVTDYYPFVKGEEFLESEMRVLATEFGRIVVIATRALPSDPITRPLPDNVETVAVGRPVTLPRSVLRTAWGLPSVLQVRGLGAVKDRYTLREALSEGKARDAVASIDSSLLHLDRYDEYVVYGYWLHIAARVALLMGDRLQKAGKTVVRRVSRGHGFDVYEERDASGRIPLRPELLGGLDAIRVVSENGCDYLRRRFPQHADKIRVTHLGTHKPSQRAELSREPLHVVTLSWVAPVKRLDRAIAPLTTFAQDRPVRWTHIGSGNGWEELRDAAVAALGTDAVNFVGAVPNKEIPQTLAGLHPSCLLSLSSSEGLPVSMMEAAALGIPTVATAVGGVPEIVVDGQTGLLLPADFTDQDLVSALRRLATADDTTYQGWSDAARDLWQREFDAARVFPDFAAELNA